MAPLGRLTAEGMGAGGGSELDEGVREAGDEAPLRHRTRAEEEKEGRRGQS